MSARCLPVCLCLHSPTLPHAHAVSKDLSWLNMAWHIVAVKTLSKGWFKSPFDWFWIISLFFFFLRHSTHPDKVLNITSQSNLPLSFPTVDYQSQTFHFDKGRLYDLVHAFQSFSRSLSHHYWMHRFLILLQNCLFLFDWRHSLVSFTSLGNRAVTYIIDLTHHLLSPDQY